MKAAYITRTGPAESLIYGDLPAPRPGPSDVLIRTEAVAINPIDTYIRSGLVNAQLSFPFVVGCDVAGTIEEPGPDVSGWQPGQRVWSTNQGLMGRQGTFAEFCAIDQQWVYPLPDNVSFEDAAACGLVGVTAHLGLFQHAGLQPGETIMVQGGSGGVGSMVVQMARRCGAIVIATAGSAEKIERCFQLGADIAINYKTESVEQRISQSTAEGVDVWWETTRDPDLDLIVSAMNERGRIVLMAGRDARPELPVGPLYVKQCSIHGFVMFKASPNALRRCAEDINRWLSEGSLQANIGRRFTLDQTASAHQLQEQSTMHSGGQLSGKIVLTPQ